MLNKHAYCGQVVGLFKHAITIPCLLSGPQIAILIDLNQNYMFDMAKQCVKCQP